MTKEDIANWFKGHNIVDQCVKNFWEIIAVYKKEDPEKFFTIIGEDESLLQPIPLRVGCEVYYPELDELRYAIQFDIALNDNVIGWYKEIYQEDGELWDNFFVIE